MAALGPGQRIPSPVMLSSLTHGGVHAFLPIPFSAESHFIYIMAQTPCQMRLGWHSKLSMQTLYKCIKQNWEMSINLTADTSNRRKVIKFLDQFYRSPLCPQVPALDSAATRGCLDPSKGTKDKNQKALREGNSRFFFSLDKTKSRLLCYSSESIGYGFKYSAFVMASDTKETLMRGVKQPLC